MIKKMWELLGVAFVVSIIAMTLCCGKAAGKGEDKYIDIEFQELNKNNKNKSMLKENE